MEIDHEYTREIVCPHCGYEFGDSWEADDYGEDNCPECDGKFTFEREVDIHYSTTKKKG